MFGLLIVSEFGLGQRTETAINFDAKTNHLRFDYENDVLYSSDHYYTGGLAITYMHQRLKNTPAQLILKAKNPVSSTYSGFGVEHRLYTPYSITDPYAMPIDRPYAAYFMASNFSVLINMEKHLKLSNEIGIGVMGPAAGGEEMQSYVHKILNAYQPIGWDEQLSNTFLLDYQFRVEKGFFDPWISTHITPIAEARVGSLKDEIAIGLKLDFGNVNGALAAAKSADKGGSEAFIWEFVFEAKIAGVLYDATLQGGPFNNQDIYALTTQDIYARQYRIRIGVNLYYQGFYLRYMTYLNSADFTNAVAHPYGGIYLGFSF